MSLRFGSNCIVNDDIDAACLVPEKLSRNRNLRETIHPWAGFGNSVIRISLCGIFSGLSIFSLSLVCSGRKVIRSAVYGEGSSHCQGTWAPPRRILRINPERHALTPFRPMIRIR